MTTCDDCGQEHRGLSWAIDDAAWLAIMGSPDGVLCPWCANDRLEKAGIVAKAQVNLNLSHLDGVNHAAIRRFEEIDTARLKQDSYGT